MVYRTLCFNILAITWSVTHFVHVQKAVNNILFILLWEVTSGKKPSIKRSRACSVSERQSLYLSTKNSAINVKDPEICLIYNKVNAFMYEKVAFINAIYLFNAHATIIYSTLKNTSRLTINSVWITITNN